jgi:hypothetical protein
MNTLEDEKRVALKTAYMFLDKYCKDRFMNESMEYSIQWKDLCVTMGAIASALNREVRLQTLAEERIRKRKEQNRENNVEALKKRGKRKTHDPAKNDTPTGA